MALCIHLCQGAGEQDVGHMACNPQPAVTGHRVGWGGVWRVSEQALDLTASLILRILGSRWLTTWLLTQLRELIDTGPAVRRGPVGSVGWVHAGLSCGYPG